MFHPTCAPSSHPERPQAPKTTGATRANQGTQAETRTQGEHKPTYAAHSLTHKFQVREGTHEYMHIHPSIHCTRYVIGRVRGYRYSLETMRKSTVFGNAVHYTTPLKSLGRQK